MFVSVRERRCECVRMKVSMCERGYVNITLTLLLCTCASTSSPSSSVHLSCSLSLSDSNSDNKLSATCLCLFSSNVFPAFEFLSVRRAMLTWSNSLV